MGNVIALILLGRTGDLSYICIPKFRIIMTSANFSSRHIGLTPANIEEMLAVIGEESMDSLIEKTIPASIRLEKKLDLEEPLSE